jgi:hypothetical protein
LDKVNSHLIGLKENSPYNKVKDININTINPIFDQNSKIKAKEINSMFPNKILIDLFNKIIKRKLFIIVKKAYYPNILIKMPG